MPEEPKTTQAVVSYYTPVELVGIYRNFLERGKSNGVVWLRGIYVQRSNQNSQWNFLYDELRDVDTNTSVTLKINRQDRSRLKPNSLVLIGGLIELNPFANGTIQIVVSVTRFEVIKDQFVTEQDIRRSEIRIAKTKRGFKNVDAVLEEKLFKGERPRVALIFASTSITMSDFNAGVNAAAVEIDFTELRQSFGNGVALGAFLKQQDSSGYDVIALIRGGGSGIEALDDLGVLQTVSEMETPIICAIGHVGEELFLKSIADKVAPTPNGLGQYFSDMVESVSEKKTRSRAALTEQIKKQFKEQLEAGQKQNKELQEKLKVLTKAQEDSAKAQQEATKKHNEQVQAAQKQNKELQEQLKGIQKSHEEQIAKLAEAQKLQQEQQKQQQEELNKSLGRMQEANNQLQKNLAAITTQNTESLKQLAQAKEHAKDLEHKLTEALNNKGGNSSLWMIVAIIAMLAFAILLIFK